MIIQCRKCETKFRFDETLITGEGVWVRCSVCKDVFFQDNLAGEPIPPAEPVKERPEVVLEKEPVVTERQSARVEILQRAYEEAGPASRGEADEFLPDDEDDTLEDEEQRRGVSPGRMLAYVLLVLLVIGGVYLWFFPPFNTQAVSEWASSLPYVGEFLGGNRNANFDMGQVQVESLKQRIVTNMVLGEMRVIEGVAINQSEFAISRVQVRGRVYDAAGAVLQERISFCGNVLTNEELASLTEDGMQKILSLNQGRDTSNDRVEAKGRIPFMVVFANVPAGPEKITVMPVGAEILLQ